MDQARISATGAENKFAYILWLSGLDKSDVRHSYPDQTSAG